MKIKSTSTLFAAGLVSLAVFSAPSQAEPNHWNRFPRHDVQPTTPRQEIRKDWRELHKDRAELGRDQAEIGRDRADLRNLYRSRASRGAIEGKKAEIRQDVREINHDRREIRDEYAELRRDRGSFGNGNDHRFAAHRDWHRNDNGRWGRGWNSGRD